MFFGLHERQLDDKGRVALPAAYRDDLGDRCVLVFGDSRCIEVHAADAFEARAAEMRDDVKRGAATIAAPAGPRPLGDARHRRPAGPDHGRRAAARLRPASRCPRRSSSTGNIDRVELWSEAVYREVAERASAELAAT